VEEIGAGSEYIFIYSIFCIKECDYLRSFGKFNLLYMLFQLR
jgi:hypothetical protein